LSIGHYDKLNLKATKKVALQIELDITDSQFDDTLVKYSVKVNKSEEESEKHLTAENA
jgi:hypothetical protein